MKKLLSILAIISISANTTVLVSGCIEKNLNPDQIPGNESSVEQLANDLDNYSFEIPSISYIDGIQTNIQTLKNGILYGLFTSDPTLQATFTRLNATLTIEDNSSITTNPGDRSPVACFLTDNASGNIYNLSLIAIIPTTPAFDQQFVSQAINDIGVGDNKNNFDIKTELFSNNLADDQTRNQIANLISNGNNLSDLQKRSLVIPNTGTLSPDGAGIGIYFMSGSTQSSISNITIRYNLLDIVKEKIQVTQLAFDEASINPNIASNTQEFNIALQNVNPNLNSNDLSYFSYSALPLGSPVLLLNTTTNIQLTITIPNYNPDNTIQLQITVNEPSYVTGSIANSSNTILNNNFNLPDAQDRKKNVSAYFNSRYFFATQRKGVLYDDNNSLVRLIGSSLANNLQIAFLKTSVSIQRTQHLWVVAAPIGSIISSYGTVLYDVTINGGNYNVTEVSLPNKALITYLNVNNNNDVFVGLKTLGNPKISLIKLPAVQNYTTQDDLFSNAINDGVEITYITFLANNTIIFKTSDKNLYWIQSNASNINNLNLSNSLLYVHTFNNSLFYETNTFTFVRRDFNNSGPTNQIIISGFDNLGQITAITNTNTNDVFVADSNRNLYRIINNTNTASKLNPTAYPTPIDNLLTDIDNNVSYVFAANENQVIVYNNSNSTFKTDIQGQNLLSKDVIRDLIFDPNSVNSLNLYIGTNKGIYDLNLKWNIIYKLTNGVINNANVLQLINDTETNDIIVVPFNFNDAFTHFTF